MRAATTAFLRAYPGYSPTGVLDRLRRTEYARLDRRRDIYLDYTGGSLYGVSQVRLHQRLLSGGVFANPHSDSRTSREKTGLVERARSSVLHYFNASPDEYLAIFTSNASGALKLVGESYPFGSAGRFLLTADNHNSVNGIREYARPRGAIVSYAPLMRPELLIDRDRLVALFADARQGTPNLFAFPAQSNFSGVHHPLELIDEAHESGCDVLLDAAAFVPTNRLDLGRWKPDFVALSFYKMFGYPTGVGCLLMRRPMLAKLRRPWFAGGTVRIASVHGDGFHRALDAAAYEDGTLNYLSLPAVEIGLRHLTSVGIEAINERVRCLVGWLIDSLTALRHQNGRALVKVHGPTTLEARGGSVAFNLFDPQGKSLDVGRIEELANDAHISLRTGCFCNPGAGETVFGLGAKEIRPYFSDPGGMTFNELRERIRGEHGIELGAIRVSLGVASNFADVFRFVLFLRKLLDRTTDEVGHPTVPPVTRANARGDS